MPQRLFEYLPFVFLATGSHRPELNVTRVLEGLLIAAVTAIATSYVTVGRLEEKVSFMLKEQARIEHRIDKVDEDCDEVKKSLYNYHSKGGK